MGMLIVIKTTKVLPSFVAQQMIRDIAMEEEKTHGEHCQLNKILVIKFDQLKKY